MVVLAKAHVKIGRGLGRILSDDPAIAQVAHVFWGMSLTAHLDVAQLIAFKLFDTHHGTMTVHYLLENAEALKNSLPHGTPEQLESVVGVARTQISALADPLCRIRAKRNRVLAHVDLTIISNPSQTCSRSRCHVFGPEFNSRRCGEHPQ